ncbi:hypothetical protein [Streptomyces sp. NPDC002588]|uniref:hypothetical protein n=1 Tax=Streptomyces sp. NPDC002588 TaxID=3154419 RepID=UPI00332DDFBE
MTAVNVREPANGMERRRVGDPTPGRTASSVEEAAIDDLALMLYRAAALAGKRVEDLLTSLSDADLGALYVSCTEKICRTHGPLSSCPARVDAIG